MALIAAALAGGLLLGRGQGGPLGLVSNVLGGVLGALGGGGIGAPGGPPQQYYQPPPPVPYAPSNPLGGLTTTLAVLLPVAAVGTIGAVVLMNRGRSGR